MPLDDDDLDARIETRREQALARYSRLGPEWHEDWMDDDDDA